MKYKVATHFNFGTEVPVKEPKTKPQENPNTPETQPSKGDDPWGVPAPSVEPTPKA